MLNRLERARGQLDAVIASVESGGRFRDVVTDPDQAATDEDGLTDELETLFLSLA